MPSPWCAEAREAPEAPEQTAAAGLRAEEAVAWLRWRLDAERQELLGRHGALLTGLAQVLGQDARTEGAAAAASPAQSGVGAAMGREEEVPAVVACGVRASMLSRPGGDPPRLLPWTTADGSRLGLAESSGARSTAELTSIALRERGLDTSASPSMVPASSNGGSSTRSKEVTQMRTTAEITSHTLRDRGLNSALDRINRQVRISQQPRERTDRTFRSKVAVVQRAADRGTRNPWFDYCMSVIIIANCMVIGLEIQMGSDSEAEPSPTFQALENVFLVTYVLELSMRIIGDWSGCLGSLWFRIDLALVAFGVLTTWVMEPLLRRIGAIGVLKKVLVIRILRLLRLVRALRFLRMMRPLWALVKSLAGANGPVMSGLVLLLGAKYVFACVGVVLIGSDQDLLSDPVAGPIVADHFGSIPVLMLTLTRFTFCDAIAQIYEPIVLAKPVMILYFLPILLLVPIALMNLITAVHVNHAIKVSTQDAELERISLKGRLQRLIPLLSKIFRQLDVHNQGFVSFHEIDLTNMTMPLPPEVQRALKSYKLEDFFKLLDADASGHITQSEWVDGLCCLILDEVPIETMQMLHMLNRLDNNIEVLRCALLDAGHGVTAADGR